MKLKFLTGIFVSFIILSVLIEDFFVTSIWTAFLIIAFVYTGTVLIGSAEYILPWIIDKIHSLLVWIFNPQVVNSNSFLELEEKLEDNAKWYIGVPYVLAVLYLILWSWEIV